MTSTNGGHAAHFPFTAVVGNQTLKQALLLNLVDPRIGGVLIRGDRGTAKSTLVRALADLLPPLRTRAQCPVVCDPAGGPCTFCGGTDDNATVVIDRAPRIVELPLGATEDRVAGTLDLEHALRTGERRFEPGLLAAANRGVLYIDEVNLLPDHLVDMLLDVAASGVNIVEREGNSVAHPARFLLVGTMNPEEGELRPQLLDRFGLVVEARTPRDPAHRTEVIRRRIVFDSDPVAFRARFAAEQAALAECVVRARALLPRVAVPESMLTLAVELCIEAGAEGLRPDITVYRAAAACAAFDGRTTVVQEDVLQAALLALPHRQHRQPFADPDSAPSVEAIVAAHRDEPPDDAPNEAPDGGRPAQPPPSGGGPSDDAPPAFDEPRDEPAADDSDSGDGGGNSGDRAPDRVAPPERAIRATLLDRPTARRGAGGRTGNSASLRGGVVGHRRWDGASHDIAPLATLLRAALRGHRALRADDLRVHARRGPARRLLLLLVDASGSMGARDRMGRTKAALLAVLAQAYTYRDEVAIQSFRDDAIPLLAGPTRDLGRVRRAIEALPVGGRTPLASALRTAAALLRREHASRDHEASLVLVTDARTSDSPTHLASAAAEVREATRGNLVIDAEAGPVRLRRAERLATLLGARYTSLP